MINRLETAVSEFSAQVKEFNVKNNCCHHWLIEKPNGPISKGVCKYCREEREFSNSPPQYSTRSGIRRNSALLNRSSFHGYQSES
ncbi:MAG: hypothetical protein ABIB93_02175 [Chloroflexota bacterium]